MARLPRAEQRNTVSAGFQSLLRNQKSQRFFFGFVGIRLCPKLEHKLFCSLECHVTVVC